MRKVLYWEVENEPGYNTWDEESRDGHGSYEDYGQLVVESSHHVRAAIPSVKILAGSGGVSEEHLPHFVAFSHPASNETDAVTFHVNSRERLKDAQDSFVARGWPRRGLILGEAWAADTFDHLQVMLLEKALMRGITHGGGSSFLGVYCSIRRWGREQKPFRLGIWGDDYYSNGMENMIMRVSAEAHARGQMLSSMWGEEYADGNEHAAEFAREYAPLCRLYISTEAFDPMFRLGWGVERCLENYPAAVTNERLSCMDVIQRAPYLWICLDGSEHGDRNGKFYHRKHLGYDPSLPDDEQRWAECLAPYYHSQRVTRNLRNITRVLSEYLGELYVEDPADPPPPPLPEPPEEVMNREETIAVKKLVKGALGAAHELDDDHIGEQPAQQMLRREIKDPLREAREICNNALRGDD